MQTRHTHACEHIPRDGVVRHASSGRPESSPFSVEAAAAWLFYAGALSPLRMEENERSSTPATSVICLIATVVYTTDSGLIYASLLPPLGPFRLLLMMASSDHHSVAYR